ncbi:MAG: hypothetical protein VCE43_14855 [Myxococcota bacterium]
MALFGKKKAQGDEGGGAPEIHGFTPQPEKAEPWLKQASHIVQTENFTYALTCYASAIKLDPGNMETHNAMFEAAIGHFKNHGTPASRKELKDIDGPGPVDRFAAAELAWTRDVNNHGLALRLLGASIKADQLEFGIWLAPKVLNMIRKMKKQSKSEYIKAKNLFAEVGAWDEAFLAGEAAIAIDPSDAALVLELKQLTAQRTIVSGGYDKVDTDEGGFRTTVKDLDEQQRLEDESSMTGGIADDRAIGAARTVLEEDSLSPEAIQKLAKLLLRKNSPESIEEAHQVYLDGYQRIDQYRFRVAAGDIRLSQATERVRQLLKKLEGADDGMRQELDSRLDTAREELQDLKSREYTERAEKYPTDRSIKFELGGVQFVKGDFEGAMANYQDCKDEPKFRVRSAHRLGNCFAEEGWHQEAVAEYRDSLASLDATSMEFELPIKYDMMASLIALARDQRSRELAEEAAEICSAIVRKDIKYRDIRERRREIDELAKSLN